MTYRLSLLLPAGLLALAACADSATAPVAIKAPKSMALSRAATGSSTPTDQHIFVMNGNSIPADFAANVAAAGGTLVRVHPEIGVAVVKGLTDAAASDLARGNGKVERDQLVQWIPSPENLQVSVSQDAVALPVSGQSAKPPQTAAALALQWNMRRIHAPEAWATRTGSPAVRVAILDSGLDAYHIEFTGIIDLARSVAFTPSTQGPPAWEDDNFHGSHVGGIISTNNFVVAGVAPNVTLIAVKVLNASGAGTWADLIAGLIYAANVHADVANLSLGALFPKSGAGQLVAALNKAVNYANSHDVLVVTASGNDHVDLQHDYNYISVPCESGTGICISATNDLDQLASYSNYGTSAIDVAAPGGDVDALPLSTILSVCSSRTTIPVLVGCRGAVGTGYAFAAGTSMAAPHVSGLAAFLDSQYGGALNPAQLETKLQQCSDDLGKPGVDPEYGQGRINAFKTVNEVGCNNGH